LGENRMICGADIESQGFERMESHGRIDGGIQKVGSGR
jgi:hypothetical protein